MPKITILTPSVRPEYLDITQRALEEQTFQDFEWLVEVGLKTRHDLCQSLNRMLCRASGELVVMLQDCIKPEITGLARFWELYQNNPKAFVTAPLGKVLKWEDTPNWDWRKKPENIYIEPHMWEADWASAPLQAFKDIGGYDENYDDGWSWENVELAWRAKFAGYTFLVDPDNPAVALDHDNLSENPFRNKFKNNDDKVQDTVDAGLKGMYKLNYFPTKVEYSQGEIVDRLAINLIKLERLPNNVDLQKETSLLKQALDPDLVPKVHQMKEIHQRIWDLEADIRQGKEGKLGLEEVGKRAIEIRNINAERIQIKNELGTPEIKIDHASE